MKKHNFKSNKNSKEKLNLPKLKIMEVKMKMAIKNRRQHRRLRMI